MKIIDKYHEIIAKGIVDNAFPNEPRRLYEPIEYILNLGGKRLRPVLVLLGTDAFDGDLDMAVKPSLAIEFFHNFSLMHDDIMDCAPLRRGYETVHKKYNVNTAILSGDALLIKSYDLLEDLPDPLFKKVTKLFTKTALELCEGQQYDIDYETKKEVSYEEYIEMITLKTGVMVGTSFQIGALIADATEKEAANMYEFGKNIGIAFQLKDDYLDLFGNHHEVGKMHAGDIFENKKTILYISALAIANEEERKELEFWFDMKTENVDKVYAVEKIFIKLKVDHVVMNLIREYTQKAHTFLDKINISEEKRKSLKGLSEYLIERQA